MDTTEAPQIIEHLSKSLNFTPFDTKWIPDTAKCVLVGQQPKATGSIYIYQLNKQELKDVSEVHKPKGIKCLTFGASSKQEFAYGDFDGTLEIFDVDTQKTSFSVQAHKGIINCIDGIGGGGFGYGAPEIVTGGRDGCVRLWDQRQKSPVLSLEPVISKEDVIADCWAVAFGNSFNNDERCIAAGYDNGDVKIFDLRQNSLLWEQNLKNGICGLEFDRKDIMQNKLVATTLEGKFYAFDLRTLHIEQGFANLEEKALKATIWGVKHIPQNRDIFATQGGDGSLSIYKYKYPKQRQLKDQSGIYCQYIIKLNQKIMCYTEFHLTHRKIIYRYILIEKVDVKFVIWTSNLKSNFLIGKPYGVIGSVEMLNNKQLCQQPVASLDWHKDKIGLGVLSGFDQTLKIVVVTKLNLH